MRAKQIPRDPVNAIIDAMSHDELMGFLIEKINEKDYWMIENIMKRRGDEYGPTSWGMLPLSYCMYSSNPNIPIFLLNLMTTEQINMQDKNGDTALHRAVHKKNVKVSRMLIDKGADPTIAANDGDTPIDFARHNGMHVFIDELKKR